MFDLLGTAGVVAQMAMLAFGFSTVYAMAVGLIAAVAWIAHATKRRDAWLLTVNSIVGCFAVYGLIVQ